MPNVHHANYGNYCGQAIELVSSHTKNHGGFSTLNIVFRGLFTWGPKSQLLSFKETIKIWLRIVEVGSGSIYETNVHGLVLKVGLSFFCFT